MSLSAVGLEGIGIERVTWAEEGAKSWLMRLGFQQRKFVSISWSTLKGRSDRDADLGAGINHCIPEPMDLPKH